MDRPNGAPLDHGSSAPAAASAARPEPVAAGRDAGAARIWEVDAARGLAVLMMAVYHTAFDLAAFGGWPIGVTAGGWRLFADATATLFLLLVGISLTLSAGWPRPGLGRPFLAKQARRAAVIFGAGMLVTAVTLAAVPEAYIRFGILHLIGVSILLALPFVGRPRLALLGAAAVLALGPLVSRPRIDGPWLLWLGVRPERFPTLDYRPLLPWFGVVLLGLALGWLLYGRRRPASLLPGWAGWPGWVPLRFLGRHALPFYLLHQPVILGVLWGLGLIAL